MVEITALENYPQLSELRRLMRYLLVWCSEGEVVLVIDENEFLLGKHQVITITSGQVHFLKAMKAAKGIVVEFTFDFFCKNDNDLELIFHNGLFCHFDQNEIVRLDDWKETERLLAQISADLSRKPYQYLISVHACLELLFVQINRAKVAGGYEIWKPDALFLKFLESVRANFRHNYPLTFHAESLQSTELKLNELAKLHTGKTAQMVIYGLIASEAKRLLTYEKSSVKEVAAALGFHDPFYFSNFFKKQTGVSPKLWREEHPL